MSFLARRPLRVKTAAMDVDYGPDDAAQREKVVAEQALAVAAAWSPPGAPESWWLTAATLTAVARDDVLRALAASIPLDRLPALLVVAALSRQAALRPDTAFARYFPRPGAPQPSTTGVSPRPRRRSPARSATRWPRCAPGTATR